VYIVYHEIKMLPCLRIIRKYMEDQKATLSTFDFIG